MLWSRTTFGSDVSSNNCLGWASARQRYLREGIISLDVDKTLSVQVYLWTWEEKVEILSLRQFISNHRSYFLIFLSRNFCLVGRQRWWDYRGWEWWSTANVSTLVTWTWIHLLIAHDDLSATLGERTRVRMIQKVKFTLTWLFRYHVMIDHNNITWTGFQLGRDIVASRCSQLTKGRCPCCNYMLMNNELQVITCTM